MDRLLKSLRGGDRQATVSVFARWADLVGESVAAHVKPLKWDGATLVVEVEDPSWATQMRFLEADLLRRVNEVSGTVVERLEIRVRRRR